ncbi:hypothetical protein BsWGS_18241 [Bradybaena similaris]
MAAAELERRGWHLTGEYKSSLHSNKLGNIDNIIKTTLDSDLKEIGAAWLNENINNHTVTHVEGPGILQLEKVLVISSPKDDDNESQLAANICRLSLSDGHISCSAVTLEPIKGLNLSTPPGSKILLSGKIEVHSNFLLLANKNISLLGGRVSNLVEPWELEKNPVKQPEPIANDGEGKRPPPFVPFGQKITNEMLLLIKNGNFQSLAKKKEKVASAEEIEFRRFREMALSKAFRDKDAKESQRAFRAGHFVIDYTVVGWIISNGFSPEEAVVALQSSFGDPRRAINNLHFERQRNNGNGNVRQTDTQQGSQPLPQGSLQNTSHSQNNHYHHTQQQGSQVQHIRIYQGDKSAHHFNQQNQQAVNVRPEPQENERQEAGKCSELTKQTQASLEKNGQLQDGRLTQSLSELNMTDRNRNQNQKPQNNVSDNIKQQEGSTNQYGGAQDPQQTEMQNTGVTTNLQSGSDKQGANTENSHGQSVHSKPTNSSSSDRQLSLANQRKGDYKSNSSSHRGSRDGTNTSQIRPFRKNYNNDQMPYRPPYRQAPHGATYFYPPPFDRQTHQQFFGAQSMCPRFPYEVSFQGSLPITGGFSNSGYPHTNYSQSYTSDRGYNQDYRANRGIIRGGHNSSFTPGVYNRDFIHGGHHSDYTRGVNK